MPVSGEHAQVSLACVFHFLPELEVHRVALSCNPLHHLYVVDLVLFVHGTRPAQVPYHPVSYIDLEGALLPFPDSELGRLLQHVEGREVERLVARVSLEGADEGDAGEELGPGLDLTELAF